MSEPMIKGAIIREMVSWYIAHHGAAHGRVLARSVPADLAAQLDPEAPFETLLASSWYPARLVHAGLEALAEGKGEAEVARLAHAAARAVTAHKMTSVYRFVLARVVTPELYAMSLPRVWRTLHSTGKRRMTILSPGVADSIVEDWPGHHPILCVVTIETMCAIFEAMGCKDVAWRRVSCVSHGGTSCVTRVTWRP